MSDQENSNDRFGEFAKRLHLARTALNLTQRAIANELKIRESSVAQWESSKSRLPAKMHLARIADIYQVPKDELVAIWEREKTESLVTNPLADKFKEARLRLGLKQSEVAKQLDVRREAVSHWERSNGSPPGQDRIEAVARLYHLDINELQQGRSTNRSYRITQDQLNFQHGMRPHIEGRPLPCFTGLPSDFTELRSRIIDAIRPESNIQWRMVSTSCSERSFFYQMHGKSMEPLVQDGAWVAFAPDRPRPRPGDIILANIGQTRLIGLLTEDQGRKFLASENPGFKGIVTPILNDADILAVGIEIQVPLLSVS